MTNYLNRKISLFTNAVPKTPKPKSAVPEMDIIPKTMRHKTFTTLANETKSLITAAQNGDKKALEQLCLAFEPLFRSEMRRDMFYNALGFEEGLSLARLKFIELVLTYNGADYEHFAGYVRCRIHFALYDEVKNVWADENKKAPLPQTDEAEGAGFSDDVIEREELSILLNLALNKLTDKQRQTIEALYIKGYSGREAAELLNCSPAMVTKNHKQALKNLRSNIA
ncbi:sigma-70 family RNA polymerase sigma factor [Phascolarctobacterium faecium]|nr:sigma-70 family RNA polymerase sigma factor [Phascolarctobacterium faecium]MDM8109385.1 sigma-70 family RNA polymerase sigma factor [Phascolarctobacterium faecium]